MDFIRGIGYSFKGLRMGITDIRLLLCGLARFAIVIILTILLAGIILVYHESIMDFLWTRPQSYWLNWIRTVLSWLISAFLVGISAVLSYLLSQILFSVLIMDFMSRYTEKKFTGTVKEPRKMPLWRLFAYLVRQEIPRALIPVLISLLVLTLSWFVAIGPIMIFLSSGITILFLAWDNTDLVPARRMIPFRSRLRLLSRNLLFHLGFGLPFLIPGLNLLFLSFAPVGGTLYFIERYDRVSTEAS
ncbi:MAG: EI24 domain-containing protein [Deltaproteobacteria bacterium]|nr:EI24 domain-containing protein [Deltaproteobacteria bacterium]